MTKGRSWIELFRTWWATARRNYKSEGSKRLAFYRAGDFAKWADLHELEADSLADLVQIYLDQLTNKRSGEPVSEATRHAHYRQVKTMLNALATRGKLSVEVELLKFVQPIKKPVWFTNEQIDTILAADLDLREKLLVRVLLDTGLRVAEALALNWEWINWEEDRGLGTIWLPAEFTKGKKEDRKAVFYRETWETFKEYKEEVEGRAVIETIEYEGIDEPVEVTPVFLSMNGCKFGRIDRLKPRGGSHIFERMTRQLGFKIRAHKFRHTCGRRMAVAGIPQQAGMKQLGHKDPNMWLHYSDLGDEEQLDVFSKLMVK
jgi:integrase